MTSDAAPVVPKVKKPFRNKGGRVIRLDLTMPQEAYCRARASGMAVAEALKTIGNKVSLNTAHQWDKKPEIAGRIAELSAMATKNAIINTGLDREWVIGRLMQVAERCMQSEPVLDKKGNPTGEYKFDAAGANQALKMLGDTMGLFRQAEKKMEDDFSNLSDDDLTRIASELAKQTGLLDLPEENVIDVTPK